MKRARQCVCMVISYWQTRRDYSIVTGKKKSASYMCLRLSKQCRRHQNTVSSQCVLLEWRSNFKEKCLIVVLETICGRHDNMHVYQVLSACALPFAEVKNFKEKCLKCLKHMLAIEYICMQRFIHIGLTHCKLHLHMCALYNVLQWALILLFTTLLTKAWPCRSG